MQALIILLAVALTLPQHYLCAAIPKHSDDCEVANCDEVLEAIGHLKGEITADPHKVTDTWGGSGGSGGSGHDHNNNNDDNNTTKMPDEQPDYTQPQEEHHEEEHHEEEHYEGSSGSSQTDPCTLSKPGEKGLAHSSGREHSSANWDEARAGCPT